MCACSAAEWIGSINGMRLLFLTETIPFPLDSGGRIKTYHTLRTLSREHEVYCHTFVRNDSQLRHQQHLAAFCRSLTIHHKPRSNIREAGCVVGGYIRGKPFLVWRHFDDRAFEQIELACRRDVFDAVYCDHLSMFEYGRRLRLPIALDAHNVEFEIVRRHAATLRLSPLRLLAELEWRQLRRYERAAYPRCRLVYTVSDVDAREIRSLGGAGFDISIVPISIDATALPQWSPITSRPEILFVGGLHWPPNADAVSFFIDRVLPRITAAVPDVHLTVVGRNDGHFRVQCTPPNVTFAGHVDTVEPYFQQSRVMVVPLRVGSGMRVKILDALARGLPIVATSIGCEGIEVVPGKHLLTADDPVAFASHVVRLINDDALTAAISANGRSLAVTKYDEAVIGRQTLEALKAVSRPQ
jgi:glycosyltransferase involved in cell wall biosynthesis